MKQADFNMYDEITRGSATETIQRAAQVLRDAAAEIERYAEHINEKDDKGEYALHSAAAAQRLHWCINHCASNVLTNLRLDLMALYAGQLDAFQVRQELS